MAGLRHPSSVVCRLSSFLPESVEPHHFAAAIGLVVIVRWRRRGFVLTGCALVRRILTSWILARWILAR
jgi:hypothetical protein